MELFLFILVNIFGTFFQGIVGFGHGLVSTPLLLTFLDKNTVLTSVMVLGIFLNIYLTIKIKEPVDTTLFYPLFIGSLIGMPFGLLILRLMPLNTMKVAVGVLSIIFTIIIVCSKIQLKKGKRFSFFVGMLSGVLQTSTSMSGPPVILFLSGLHLPKHTMRKLLIWYFLWLCVTSLILFAITGIVTTKGVLYGIYTLPFVLIAGYLGNKVAHSIPHEAYRIIALVTVLCTGAIAVYSGIQ